MARFPNQGNGASTLERFVEFAKIVTTGETQLVRDVANLVGVSTRTAHRYVKAMKSYDPRLKSEPGHGGGIRYNRNQRI